MTLKEKIKSGKKLIGTHINLNDVAVGRIAGLAGYDYVWIDLEHSYLSLENLMAHIIAVKSGGSSVIVRAPQDDFTFTKKILEMGVDGIIFPMVKTAEQAKKLIDFTLYPPYGNRGFGPMGAVDFGFRDVADYIEKSRDEICRFIQIEHIDTINNLDEIMKNEFIDGFVFGPYDLSGSINELGKVFEDNTVNLIKDTVKKLKANSKTVALSTGDTSEEVFSLYESLGVDMLSAGSDYGFLKNSFLNNRIMLEKSFKKM